MSTLFAGTKGTGKTYLMVRSWAARKILETRFPLLVVDPRLVESLAHLYHASTAKEALSRVAVTGAPTAYKPRSEADFDGLVRGVDSYGEIILAIDEVRCFLTSRSVSEPLVELSRVERNRKVPLAYTTQSYSDVGRELMSDLDDVYIGRHTDIRDLEAIEKRWNLPRARVEVLKDREFVYRETGKVYGPEE